MSASRAATLIVLLSVAAVCPAEPSARVTANIAGNVLDDQLAEGDIVPVTFYVASDSEAPVFGVELEIKAKGHDVRIVSVSVDSAFSQSTESAQVKLPAESIKITRTQPSATLNRTLGANGQDVPFATVDLKVLSELPFASALDVTARVALLGQLPQEVTVLGVKQDQPTGLGRGRHKGKAKGKLAIYSNVPASVERGGDPAEVNRLPWTTESVGIALSVYEPDGTTPVTSLIAGQTYELHYDAGTQNMDSYLVYTAGSSPGCRLATVMQPREGTWAGTRDFAADLTSTYPAADPSTGASLFDLAAGLHMLDTITATRPSDSPTATTGHLFDFTPSSSGLLHVAIIAWDIEAETLHTADLTGQLVLQVVSGR